MSNEAVKHWQLDRLSIFVCVAETGSLTGAGVVLGMPQPAVSRQIARLESECKGRLFHRTGRGMALTELGERLLPRMQSILAEAKGLSADINGAACTPSGEVRIGALPSLYLTLIVPLFYQMRAQYPSIKLHVVEGSGGQIDQWLTSGQIDIGLPYRYGERLSPDVERLISVESFLISAPGNALTQAETVNFEQMHDLPLVLPGAPSSVRLRFDQLAKRVGIKLNVVMEADSMQIQKYAVGKGDIYTVLPKHAVSAEVESGFLQAARITNPEIGRSIVLAMTAVKPASQAVRAVAKAIRHLMVAGQALGPGAH
jgi:LysR family nitrogen assimilation transcriptional regulator